MASIIDINNHVQKYLIEHDLEEIELIKMSKILDDSAILRNLEEKHGLILRNYAYQKKIIGAYQLRNNHWMIKRIKDYENLISIQDAAKELGLTPHALYKMIHRKKLIPVKIGKKFCFKESQIKDLKNKRRKIPMKDSILETFYQLAIQSDKSQSDVTFNGPLFSIKVLKGKNSRVQPFLILVTEQTLEALNKEYFSDKGEKIIGYGEVELMRLFSDIIQDPNESWLVDTDVLNWNLKVGMARNIQDFYDTFQDWDFNITDMNLEFYKEDNMVGFIFVQLADYMS